MLFWIRQELSVHMQELRGEASLSRGLSNPGISFISFLYSDKYRLPFYQPYGKSDYLQLSLSLIWIAYVL